MDEALKCESSEYLQKLLDHRFDINIPFVITDKAISKKLSASIHYYISKRIILYNSNEDNEKA